MTNLEIKTLEQIKKNLEDSSKFNTLIYKSTIDSGKFDFEYHFGQNSQKDRLISDSLRWIEAMLKSTTCP